MQKTKGRADGGECSDRTSLRALWKLIWNLNCPNKVKHFMWRACKNILPTKCKLRARGIGVEVSCDLCGGEENSGHILWSCKAAKEVWRATSLKLPSLPDFNLEFVDIMWEIMERFPMVDWELFSITAWSLSNNRNKHRPGGRTKQSDQIVKEAVEYAKEVKQVKLIPT